MKELLVARGITKFFAATSVLANDNISLSIGAGEILALVGENGAGKSTFARVIAGMVAQDSGTVTFKGRGLKRGSVRASEAAGIGLVPQHSFLAESLRLYEALALGREPRRLGVFYDKYKARREMEGLCTFYGFGLNPETFVGDLSPAERRHAEMLRVLAWGGELLLLDEPTSLLSETETETLFGLARRLAAHGRALVFITHRVAELRSIATRIAVLRDCALVADRPAGDFDEPELVSLMSPSIVPGRTNAPRSLDFDKEQIHPGGVCKDEASPPRAEARGLLLTSARGGERLDFVVCAGECLGIVALPGNGLGELEEIAAGLLVPKQGRFLVAGKENHRWARSRLRAHALGYVPSDREGRGLALEASVADNLIVLERGSLTLRDWLLPGRRESRALVISADLGPGGNPRRQAESLSGGNRQRLLLSRELSAERNFILLAEPSQGLDLEGREALGRILKARRDNGIGILLLSSSIEEVTTYADRVAVLYRGALVWQGPNQGPSMARELTARFTGLTGAAAPPNPSERISVL